VLADAVAFFHAFAGMEGGFRERAESVSGLLRSDATRYVIVCSPHRDTVAEAAWFARQLSGQGIDRFAGIANRVHPSFGPGSAADAAAREQAVTGEGRAGEAALWRNLAELRAFAEADRAELGPFTELLGSSPFAEVPLLAGDVHDLAGLVEIREHVFAG
jgi:hypothetical protein